MKFCFAVCSMSTTAGGTIVCTCFFKSTKVQLKVSRWRINTNIFIVPTSLQGTQSSHNGVVKLPI